MSWWCWTVLQQKLSQDKLFAAWPSLTKRFKNQSNKSNRINHNKLLNLLVGCVHYFLPTYFTKKNSPQTKDRDNSLIVVLILLNARSMCMQGKAPSNTEIFVVVWGRERNLTLLLQNDFSIVLANSTEQGNGAKNRTIRANCWSQSGCKCFSEHTPAACAIIALSKYQCSTLITRRNRNQFSCRVLSRRQFTKNTTDSSLGMIQ